MRHTFFGSTQVHLRGQEVMVDFTVTDEPDPSVGAGLGYEIEGLEDLDGNPLGWELTDKELLTVGEAINEHFEDSRE